MRENKIIQFPGVDYNHDNEEVDSEDWEGDYYYYDRHDWKGLLKHREEYAKQNEDDPYAQWRLGEAYILNGELNKALEFLTNLYGEYPDFLDVQYSLLDTLFGLNKTEEDFNWIKKPNVIRLDKDFLDACYTYLKGKRKQRTLNDSYCDYLILQGYIKFTEKELYCSLVADERFIVEGNDDFPLSAKIKVTLQKKRNK